MVVRHEKDEVDLILISFCFDEVFEVLILILVSFALVCGK